MKRDFHTAAAHASYLTRYAAMAAGSESAGSTSAVYQRMTIDELRGVAEALGFDLVARVAKVEEAA